MLFNRSFMMTLAFIAAVAALAPCSTSAISVEGKLKQAARVQSVDLQIEVKSVTPGSEVRMLSMLVPKVSLVDGRFKYSLPSGLIGFAGQELAVSVKARPFESYKPFEDAEAVLVTHPEFPLTALVDTKSK